MMAAGDHAAAGSVFREVMQIGRVSALLPVVLHALLGLAMLAFDDNNAELALMCVAAIRQHPATEHQVRTQAEAEWESYAARVGAPSAMQVWNTAQDMPLTTILDQALGIR
jgi:hypothetical protein